MDTPPPQPPHHVPAVSHNLLLQTRARVVCVIALEQMCNLDLRPSIGMSSIPAGGADRMC